MALLYRNAETYRSDSEYRSGPLDPSQTAYKDFKGVLNQLAGTYGLGESAAANANWAGTAYGANAVYESLLGALNEKNGTVGLGLNLVCNELAGTSGLYATAALNSLAGNGGS